MMSCGLEMENQLNRSSFKGIEYTFVDDITDDAIIIDTYSDFTFENLYFHENQFYYYTGLEYRMLHIHEDRGWNKFVCCKDVTGISRTIYLAKMKRERNLD